VSTVLVHKERHIHICGCRRRLDYFDCTYSL